MKMGLVCQFYNFGALEKNTFGSLITQIFRSVQSEILGVFGNLLAFS